MAVYYFGRTTLSRKSGGNAVAAAAYRHATRMTDEQTGATRDYSGKKPELVHAEISLPENAPAWAVARYGKGDVDAASSRLWNDIEVREDQHKRHSTAQLAYSYIFALPAELSHDQNIALVRDFAQTSLVVNGAVADWVIHDKDDGNPHAHVMTAMRTLGKTGLDRKIDHYQDRRQDIVNLRFNWACAANTALETAGFEARIDHRRLDVQGIELGAISFNSEIAANIEQGDEAYRVKQRVMEARLANETYLMEHPEHMLTVVAAGNPLFTEADLERGFQQYLPSSVGRKGIADLMRRAMASADLVRLNRKSSRDEDFMTTRAVVEMMRQMEQDAVTMAQSRLVLEFGQGGETLPDTLSDEQRVAVRAMITPARLTLVTGYAGTGKTFAVKEAARIWAARGFEVLGGAISGKAAQELRGIEGEVATLAQWEARWDRGERPAQGRFVFVMDEAGMVGTAIWSRMQARINAMGGKLIGLGDAAQLAPIQDTAAFKHLTKLVGQVTIGEVRRQRDAGDRRATEMLSRGGAEAARAIDHYARKGAIRFEGSLGAAIDALSKAYFEDGGTARIALTHRNADVDALNGAIRIEALARGVVDHKSQVAYARGKGVDPLGWQGISCPRNPLVLGIGDRVRFTRPFREASVTKSSFATVLAASETQLILSVDGQNGVVVVDPRAFLHFDYGYAATVHKSQGMTMTAVYVLLTEQFDAHLLDVALSRHVQGLGIWVPEDQVEDVAAIKKMVQRSSLIDVVQRPKGAAPVLRRMTRDISDVAVGARLDRIAADPQKRVLVTSLAGDVHLTQQGMRMAGLLRAGYEPGQPDLADDPRGLAIDPLKAVDDLLSERGVFRAADVAARLGEVVRAPDLFMRLYTQAMAHPDLVVLSEDGLRGEGRVYTSASRVAQVAGLMDRGITLAVTQGFEAVEPSLESSLIEAAAQSAGLSDAGRAGLHHALWPSRIGILEEIGTNETARVVQALGEIARDGGSDPNGGSDAQVIAVSADARAASRFGGAAGIEGMGLYAFGNRLRQGSLSLRAGDILVVPEASGLHVDDIDLLMGFAEDSGAKLLLHSDPSLEAPGAVVRHLSARIETQVLGGFEAIAPDRRGLVEGGAALEVAYKDLWNRDVFTGSGNEEEQIDEYVAGFVVDETSDKLGVASSARLRDALNIRIEAELLKKNGIAEEEIHQIDRGEAPALAVHEGTVLVLRRDSSQHGLDAGARGVVRSVDAAGQVTVRFEVQDVIFTPGAQAAGLDYGAVLSAREARGVAADSLHGFAGRGLSRTDLIAMLIAVPGSIELPFTASQPLKKGLRTRTEAHKNLNDSENRCNTSADRFSLSLPVDPDSEGAAFLRRALAREGRASALDYGFDPKRALAAAATATAAAVQGSAQPSEPDADLSAADLAVRSDTETQFKAQPAFIVSALVRENGRFDHGQLLHHVQKLFPAAEYPEFDHKAFTDQVLAATLKQGALIKAGFSSFDGAALYTTRVQAEIEARGLAEGKALARAKLPDIGHGIGGADMVGLPDDVAHVAGAERLSLVMVDPGPHGDAFLKQAGAVWRERGYQVIATSTRGVLAEQAAARLGDGARDGVQHASLASLEAQWAMGHLPEERFVVFMDGADRVQSLQWMRVQARVSEMGGKLIAVSHSSGLSPIGSISLHRLLAREVGVEARGGIAHQVREDERVATSYLSQPPGPPLGPFGSQAGSQPAFGSPAVQALDIYNDKGAVRFAGRSEGAQAAIARSFWAGDYQQSVEKDGELRLAMAHSRATANTLDALIRAEGQRLGRFGEGETCWGRRVNIGEVLEAQSDIALAGVKAGDRGRVVKLGPESIEMEMPGHRDTVEIYTSSRMAEFASGIATTLHDAESRVVDRSYLYASRGMDQEMFRTGMTRHRLSLELHVPETAFRDYAALQKAVQRNTDLEILASVGAEAGPNETAREAIIAPCISDRVDRTGPDLWSGSEFGFDAHLQATASRIAGLLAIDYKRGAPVLGEDPRGYASDPLKLVDDLLAERSVIRASDVARGLAQVVRDPDSFVRLFAEAMAHPDLVVLSEEGLRGEGRVYSSTARIAQVAGLMDRGITLAVSQGFEAVEPSLVEASAESAGLSDAGRAGLHHALWPARIGILEEIGTSETARVVQALGKIARDGGSDRNGGSDAQVIAVSADARTATRFGGAAGIEGMGLYAFGNRLRQGSLSLRQGDILVVPEASGLHVDDLDLLMGFAEDSGAKLLLHSDPSLEAPGAVVRHLSARIETQVLGGFEAIAPDRRGLVEGGAALEVAYKDLWNRDVFTGSGNEEEQIDAYVAGFMADGTADKLGVASSARMRDVLNIRIEAELLKKNGVSADEIHQIDRGNSPALAVHEGTVLVLRRDDVAHGLDAGTRGVVRSVDAAGQVTVRFEVQDVIFTPGAQAAGLDYGAVLSAREARGMAADSLHGFAGRSLSRTDLIAMLNTSADRFSLSLPVDPDNEGAAFLRRALAREGRASALDYGFDPKRALAAAAATAHQGRGDASASDLPLSADDLAVRAQTAAHLQAQPAFIVSALVRENGRFDQRQLLHHVQKLFPAAEYPEFDHKAFTDQVLAETLKQGALIEAGNSRFDGAALYTTRVQAEIEAQGLAQGKALARAKLADIGHGIGGEDMVGLPDDVAHVAGAERLSLVTVDPGPQGDAFLKQAGAVWRKRGYQVIATSTRGALAEQAAARLGAGGSTGSNEAVQHASLASLEAQWAMGRLPEERFVVFMDGADRVQSLQWMRVQARVSEMGGKLIAVGHSSGLTPIGSVSLHRLLAREVGIGERGGIAHQVQEDERVATSYLAQSGEPAAKALDIYNNKGAVRFAGRSEGAQAAIARAYWANDYQQEVAADGELRLAMAHSRATADTLDALIRAEGQRLGRLGESGTCWGRRVNIGEVLEAQSDIALAGVKAGDRGRVVKLGSESIEMEMPGHRDTVEIYTSTRMAEFSSGIATTLHDAQTRVVDRSWLYASRGMDQEMFRTGMTRHRQSLEVHVPETAFRDYAALQKAVQRNSELEMLASVGAETGPNETAREVIVAPGISDRVDRSGPALWSGGEFGFDAHLQATASRIAGLLAIDYKRGAPVLGEDPRGYASDPLKLVNDLLASRSVIRASDVARGLSQVVRDPDSFVRLFAEAMAHPDLVVLSEEGLRGEGRVYSTLAHIRRELDLVDKVSALALAQNDLRPAEKRLKAAARTEHGVMSPDQERALRHAVSPARVAMIAGYAGSGKSSVLKGVREVYEREGWNVVGAALAGKAAQGLENASGIQSYTLAALGFAAAQERVTLGRKSLLVIDEAGMLNADHFEMVLDLVERTGASLRLVGDPRQLQPRGPGAMWRACADRIGTVDLTTVWRQRDPGAREATRNLAAGGEGADLAIDHFLDKGIVRATGSNPNGPNDPSAGSDPNAGSDRDALLTAAVAGYSADPHEDKMLLTYRLADVDHLNRLARADDQARRSNELPRIAVTGSGGDVLELQAGDRIAFRENRRAQGIVNGMTGLIAAVNPARQSFTVQIGTDKDEARYITLKAEDSPELDYGYATTLHKIQGGTHESSHLVVTGGFNHNLLYVGATRYSGALAIYVPVAEDKAGDYLKTIARRDMVPATTLEAAYGFDPAKGFEAARQAKVEGRIKAEEDRAEDGDLGAYMARHNGVSRNVPMVPGPLSRLFTLSPEREALAPGADTRALSDVIGAHILGHGRQMEAEVQAGAMRLLQDVSSAKSWGRICKALPRDIPARAEAIATRWTNSTSGDDLLPEAHAFGRAIAIAAQRGDATVSRALKSGLELLSARVGQARREGSYDQMLKAANAPAPASQELLPEAQPIKAREWRPQHRVAPMRSSGVWLGGAANSIGELAVARQVLRSLSSKGPGFWETLLSDYGDHRKQQAARGGAPVEKEKTMEQSAGMKPGFNLEAVTPITEAHQKVLAHALDPDATRMLTEGIALADYAGQIGAGTMKFGDMQKTANAFRLLAEQAGSIGPCDPLVPEAWKARLLGAVTAGAAFEKKPKVESVEEWKWALSHSLRIGALATGPEDLTRGEAGDVPTWADHLFTRMISDMGHRRPGKSSSERMDWNINLSKHISETTYVPVMKVSDAALALAKSDPAVIKDKLAGEQVPQEWKDRLTARLNNRNDYSKHPLFGSLAEFEWAVSTLVKKGAEVSTGRTPTPNDLVKAAMEEKGPGMSMRPF